MKETTKNSYTERMLKVLVFIQNHLDEDLSLEELAGVACFSPYHFHRIFRGMVGEGLAQYVRRLRLQRAAYYLKNSRQSVTDLAFAAGYETVESFIRAFRRLFGMTPTCYRERTRCPGWAGQPSDDDLLALLQKERGHKMDVKIVKQDGMRVIFVRHVGPYDECGPAWERLCGYAGSKGLMGPEAKFLGISHDDPMVTQADKLRYDACMTVGPEIQPEGEVGVQDIPGGEYAMVLHKGPYENLKETYAALCGQWLPRSGREVMNTPCYEVYLNDHNTTPPKELLTEIYMPLK
jgi:AraC family transcriptional regulator